MSQTVILLDVGPSMAAPPDDGGPRKLDLAVRAVTLFVQRILDSAIGKKGVSDEVALVLVGTDGTDNPLAEDSPGHYEHITVHQGLEPPTMRLVRFLANSVTPGGATADAVDMVCTGLDCFVRNPHGKKKKAANKTLLIFSDLKLPCDVEDQYGEIIAGLRDEGVQLKICGPDGPEKDWSEEPEADDDAGVTEPDKPNDTMTVMECFCKDTRGLMRSLPEAVRLLVTFEVGDTLLRPTFSGPLEIGPLKIRVQAFLRQKRKPAVQFKSFSNHVVDEDVTDGTVGGVDIKSEFTTESGDKIDKAAVRLGEDDAPEVLKGYRFGKSTIPVPEAAMAEIKLDNERSLKFVAFVDKSKIRHYDFMGSKIDSIQPADGDASATAMAALCAAMKNKDVYMIVRSVSAKGRDPKLYALWPHMKPFADPPYQCLLGAQIPYSDDFQDVDLPDFTTNGVHEPSKEQQAEMDRFVDGLDLTHADKDAEGEPMEALQPKYTCNPSTQRVLQCIRDRALKGTLNPAHEVLPKIDPRIKKTISPHLHLWKQPAPGSQAVGALFPLTEVDAKKSGRARASGAALAGEGEPASKRGRMPPKEQSISSILRGTATRVGDEDPVSDYRSMVESTENDFFETATQQLQQRVMSALAHEATPAHVRKVVACVEIMREKCAEALEADTFNSFVLSLKETMAKSPAKHDALFTALKDANIALIADEDDGAAAAPVFDELPPEAPAAAAASPAPVEEDLDEL